MNFITTALVSALVFFLLRFLRSNKRISPPSPPALPLIGHLHLFDKAKPLYHTLAQLSKKYGPYVLLRFGSHPMLIVSSAEAAKEVLKTQDLAFASRPRTSWSEAFNYDGAGMVFAPYGDYWKNVRKVCTLELFTIKRLQYFRPIRTNELVMFLRKLSEASGKEEVVNMSESIAKFTYSVMLKIIMGKSYFSTDSTAAEKNDEAEKALAFLALTHEANEAAGEFHISDCFPWLKRLDFSLNKMRRIGRSMDKFLQLQVDEHRAKFDKDNLKDFIDVLISVSDLGDTAIKALTMELTAAGTETSSTTVEFTLAEVVRNPVVLKKAQEELDDVVGRGAEIVSEDDLPQLKYLQAVVKESFRLHPPSPTLLPHYTTVECKLEAGYQIPAGTQTLVNVYAIGRDSSIWEDPLEFKPERMMDEENAAMADLGKSFELLPFGYGRRSCPGMNIGMTTVHLTLANLLYKFDWKMVDKVEVSEAVAYSLRKAHPLRLIPISRA